MRLMIRYAVVTYVATVWLAKNNHHHKDSAVGNLPPKSVAHIKKLLEEKTRYSNNEIINSLRRHNCPQLTKLQINNLKQRLKVVGTGVNIISASI